MGRRGGAAASHSGRLRLRAADGPQPAERAEFKYVFKPGRWYHVALAHTAGGRLFTSRAAATLYVDGKAEQSLPLRYPPARAPKIYGRRSRSAARARWLRST